MYALASIVTRYLGPTNYRGARVVVTRGDARTGDKRITVGWDHARNPYENHLAAAQHYARHMDWAGEWIGGCGRDGEYVWVRCTGDNAAFKVIR